MIHQRESPLFPVMDETFISQYLWILEQPPLYMPCCSITDTHAARRSPNTTQPKAEMRSTEGLAKQKTLSVGCAGV